MKMKRISQDAVAHAFFYSTAFFLLTPNFLKEIPFILFSIFYFFCSNRKIDKKLYLLVNLFFFINFISLLYSDDLKYGFRRIEGFLPFIYFAIPLAVQSKLELDFFKWSKLFNYINILFLILFLIYSFVSFDYSWNYNHIRTELDQLSLLSIHPIYLSIIGFVGLMCTFKYIKSSLRVIFVINNLFLIFLSGTRSTVLFLVILALVLSFTNYISKRAKFLSIGLLISLAIFFLGTKTDFRARLREVILPVSYNNFNINNSTSVRNAVWKCDLRCLKKTNLLLGNGVGDTQYNLDQCFKISHSDLIGYNSHNQYFGIIFSTGFLGILSLFVLIIIVALTNLNYKNIYFLIILNYFLFLFIFENILERKNGILFFLFSIYFIFNTKEKYN